MRHVYNFFRAVLCFFFLPVLLAQDTNELLTKLAFEDAQGNTDTITLGYHPEASTTELNPQFGEASVENFSDREFAVAILKNDTLLSRTVVVAAEAGNCRALTPIQYSTPGDVPTWVPDFVYFKIRIKAEHFPVKVSWNVGDFYNNSCVGTSGLLIDTVDLPMFTNYPTFDNNYNISENLVDVKEGVFEIYFIIGSGIVNTYQPNIPVYNVFPNPAVTSLKLSINLGVGSYKVKIFDSFGRIVKQISTTHLTEPIDISDLSAAGMYYMQINEQTGKIWGVANFEKL